VFSYWAFVASHDDYFAFRHLCRSDDIVAVGIPVSILRVIAFVAAELY